MTEIFNDLQFLPTFGLIILSGLLGVVIGSFINVVIVRVPKILERQWQSECSTYFQIDIPTTSHETFNCCQPASHCPHCKHPLQWFDLVPVLSYLWLRGQCRYCQQKIAGQYPLVEILSGIIWVVIIQHFGFSITTVAYLIVSEALLALSVIDLNTQLLPDDLTLPLMWLGLLWSVVTSAPEPSAAILGAALGYSAPWLLGQVYYKIRGKEGMGYGDFKLFAALGAWLGVYNLPFLLLLSALLGLVFGGIKLLTQKFSISQPLPFGPAIALAGWLLLVAGEPLRQTLGRLLLGADFL